MAVSSLWIVWLLPCVVLAELHFVRSGVTRTELSVEELEEIRLQFDQLDADRNGHITASEIGDVFKALGESVPGYKIRDLIRSIDVDENGTVEFTEFLILFKEVKHASSALKQASNKLARVTATGGASGVSAEGTTHVFSNEEKVAFADFINKALSHDVDTRAYLPIDEANAELFEKIGDGILLCKMINTAVPNTIDERAINKGKLNTFTRHENLILALNSARTIGCNIVNTGPQDLAEGRPHLVLGLLWQIIREELFRKITLQQVPGLLHLMQDGEDLGDLVSKSPEEILIRWVNYHLERAGSPSRIHNFAGDIQDSEVYATLLSQIAPADSGVDRVDLTVSPLQRAEAVLRNADRLGCKVFVTPQVIVKGNPRLNMAFVAYLFNNYPALPPLDDAPDFDLGDYEETREEKAFRNWMNSLGVSPYVSRLHTSLSDGLILLQLLDKVQPGIVNWDKVNKGSALMANMGGNMKKLENCNYVVELCHKLKFSVVGIGGSDILNGNKTLVDAIVWQLMRAFTFSVLQKLTGSDRPVTDADVVETINSKLSGAGKSSRITSFKDPSIATSRVILELVDAIRPGSVNFDIYSDSTTEEDLLMNARYALSMTRKIGVQSYLVEQDIVEVKPKMVLTLCRHHNSCFPEKLGQGFSGPSQAKME